MSKDKFEMLNNFKTADESHFQDWKSWLQKQLHIGAWSYVVETKDVWWSEGVFEIYGLDPQKGIVEDYLKFYSKEGQKKIENHIVRSISEQKGWDDILEIVDANGGRKWVRSIGEPLHINGQLVLHGSIQDVSEKFLNSQFLDSILWNSPNSIIKIDFEGKIEFVNKPLKIFDDFIDMGINIVDCFGDENGIRIKSALDDAKKNKKPVHFEAEINNEVNEKLVFHSIVSPIVFDTKVSGFILSLTDVTRFFKNKEELRKQQHIAEQNARLASIGELAAGIGHEINNPLAIIAMSIESLKQVFENGTITPERTLESLEKVTQATDRIANIVKGLRTFSRDDKENIEIADLRVLTCNTFDFVKDLFAGENIELNFESDDHPIASRVVPGKVQQVILNLLNNSRDALNERNVKKVINVSVKADQGGDFAEITVSDNGPGIPKEMSEKIFDAFYTTKPVGEGTGLGLYISRSILQSFDGDLMVGSSNMEGLDGNKGAKFTLKFPTVDVKELQIETKNDGRNVTFLPTSMRILIVEDEEDIREILCEGMRENGIEVYEAGNGKEAIEYLMKEKFDYVFSDIKMPKMNGKKLFQKIHEMDLHNRPKLVFMTGGEIREEINLADAFLLKPFELRDLLDVIQKLHSDKAA